HGRDEPADELLSQCYRHALERAEEKGLASIAFPALSTGAFGFPLEEAAKIALGTIVDEAPRLQSVHHIRFVLYSQSDAEVHEHVLERLTD
ncbi:MAG TPA: macro domain-containing protein, partial [Myxococcota bacterium]|nr:macro domain-containing protein [Myxococcota bacterium]